MKIFLQNHKPFEKHFKIKFKEPQIKIHSNGFFSVTLDWTSTKDTVNFWRFKYPQLAHITFGGAARYKNKTYLIHSAAFEFPDLSDDDLAVLKMTSWFDICIGHETDEEYSSRKLEYVFFEKTKYGLICWFAPNNWEDWNNAKDFEQ